MSRNFWQVWEPEAEGLYIPSTMIDIPTPCSNMIQTSFGRFKTNTKTNLISIQIMSEWKLNHSVHLSTDCITKWRDLTGRNHLYQFLGMNNLLKELIQQNCLTNYLLSEQSPDIWRPNHYGRMQAPEIHKRARNSHLVGLKSWYFWTWGVPPYI